MKRFFKWGISICILLTLLVSSLLFYASDKIYYLTLDPRSDKTMFVDYLHQLVSVLSDDLIEKNEDAFITSTDGLQLHSYQFEQKSDTWVIVVHGYMGQGSQMGWAIKRFYNWGYNVLAPDLRGHGQSEGDYIGMGWDDRLDIIQWIDYILDKNKNSKIILYGASMGAATVMNVGGEKLPDNVKLIIEDSGYTTPEAVFSHHLENTFNIPTFPLLSYANIVAQIRAGYSISKGPIDQLHTCKLPILFIHGKKDTFVPFYMMEELYDSYQGEKEKIFNDSSGHAQFNQADPKKYWDTIKNFIKKHLS